MFRVIYKREIMMCYVRRRDRQIFAHVFGRKQFVCVEVVCLQRSKFRECGGCFYSKCPLFALAAFVICAI